MFCVADENVGVLCVPNAAYFRRQADICLRLSLIASDDAISARLMQMARDYRATGEALEQQGAVGPPTNEHMVGPTTVDGEEGSPMAPPPPNSSGDC
jgi:hypothetical protein